MSGDAGVSAGGGRHKCRRCAGRCSLRPIYQNPRSAMNMKRRLDSLFQRALQHAKSKELWKLSWGKKSGNPGDFVVGHWGGFAREVP
jgi:hypothetical protein